MNPEFSNASGLTSKLDPGFLSAFQVLQLYAAHQCFMWVPQACAVFYLMSHSPSPTNVSKKLEVKLGTVAHAFNQEAELGRFLSLRPAMITE